MFILVICYQEKFHRRVLFGLPAEVVSVGSSSFVLEAGSDNIFLEGGGKSSSLSLLLFIPLSEMVVFSPDDLVLFLACTASSKNKYTQCV